jgi:hypothetical protein
LVTMSKKKFKKRNNKEEQILDGGEIRSDTFFYGNPNNMIFHKIMKKMI